MNPPESCRWVKGCLSQNCIPNGALFVGYDADQDAVYAGRAEHEGEVMPAKVIPAKNVCYVTYDGEEILKDQFEVLVPATLCWQWACEGAVPPAAVQIGATEDGEKLYFGRVMQDGILIPGKILPSHGTCYYGEEGEEKNCSEYECLVLV